MNATQQRQSTTDSIRFTGWLVVGLFAILPFLPILKYGFPIASLGDSSLTTLIKEALFICMLIAAAGESRIFFDGIPKRCHPWLALLVFSTMMTIASTAPIKDAVNGLRYELMMSAFFFLYYISSKKYPANSYATFELIRKINISQFFVVCAIGYVEMFNKDIRILLYKEKAHSLVTGFPGVSEIRLVSTLENPINLGLFLCISLSIILSKGNQKHIRWTGPALWMIGAPVVFMTLSRLSILIYGALGAFYLIRSLSASTLITKTFVTLLMISTTSFAVSKIDFSEMVNLDAIQKRTEQATGSDEYKNDPRIQNWSNAFSRMSDAPVISHLFGLGIGISNPAGENDQLRIENSYISVYIQTGIVGSILWTIIISGVIRNDNYRSPPSQTYQTKVPLLIILMGAVANDMHRNLPFSGYLWLIICMKTLWKK